MADIELNLISQDITLEVQSPEVDLTLDLNSFHSSTSSPVSYVYQTLTPSETWVINHNLNYKPLVQLFNSGSQMIFGHITHINNNQVRVAYTMPVSGFARLI